FDNLKTYLDKRVEGSKEVYLTESLQDLIDSGFKIAAVKLKKGVLDFGRPSEVLNGNKYLLDQKSVNIEDFQELNIVSERSFIKGPVFIGKNTKISYSVVGPYVSIGCDSNIENCILENYCSFFFILVVIRLNRLYYSFLSDFSFLTFA
ncbi:unnamed protein product, partial [marine sediment metagenome]